MGTPRRTKACWACRSKWYYLLDRPFLFAELVVDSKVRCDLSNPICSNCVRSGKSCQYGLRLSWPREGDARRSILSRGNYPIAPTGANFEPYFLNVGHTDTTLGFIISSSLPTATYELFHDSVMSPLNTTPKSIPRSLRWIASGGGEFENILLSRCKNRMS